MMHKYMLLSAQHDALQKHLSSISRASPAISTSSSPSYSPERGQRSPRLSSSPIDLSSSYSPFAHRHHHRSSVASTRSRHMSASMMPPSSASGSTQLHNDNFINPFDPSGRRYSMPPAVFDESLLSEIESDEHKLRDVNLQIKTTLTDLLNCEDVRCDTRSRTWVQERLMDAERELKGGRCRSRSRRVSEDLRRLGYL